MKHPLFAIALGLAATSLVSACKKDTAAPTAEASGTSAVKTEATLAQALAENPQFSTAAAAFKDTGMEGVLAGKASYTLFAPTNAAFEATGDAGKALMQPEQRAALAALLREHIVPGQMTADDLGKALDAAKGKALKLRTVGKGTLSVTRDGSAIVVAGPDGQKGKLTSDSARAKNGAALGVDTVLKTLK